MAGINCYEDVIRIIRYVVIGISWCCALLNVLVIIMEKMAKRSFDNILMQVQIMYVVLCSAILTYYPGLDKTYHCQLQAYIYYASWFTANCLTLVLQVNIIRLLKLQIEGMSKRLLILKCISYGAGLLIFCIPLFFGSYHECGAGLSNCHFYCGLCRQNEDSSTDEWVMWINWVLPASVVVVWGIVQAFMVKSAVGHSEIGSTPTNQQKMYRNIAHIPSLTFILLFLNLLTKVLTAVLQNQYESLFELFVLMNMLFYVVPISNLVLFILYVRTDDTQLRYFQWMLCRNKDISDKLLRSEAFSQRLSKSIE